MQKISCIVITSVLVGEARWILPHTPMLVGATHLDRLTQVTMLKKKRSAYQTRQLVRLVRHRAAGRRQSQNDHQTTDTQSTRLTLIVGILHDERQSLLKKQITTRRLKWLQCPVLSVRPQMHFLHCLEMAWDNTLTTSNYNTTHHPG